MVYGYHQGLMSMKNYQGQSTIEFTFAMVMVALLIYGLLQLFRWTGMDYAERAFSSERFKDIAPGGDVTDQIKHGDVFLNFQEDQLKHDQYRTQRLSAFTRNF